jgi:DNA-binding transcriptional LysR family regulator
VSLVDRVIDVVDDGVDVALRIATALAPGLAARQLLDTSYVLVATSRYLKKAGVPTQPQQLAAHPVFYLGYAEFQNTLTLQRAGATEPELVSVPLHGRLTINNSAAIMKVVEDDAGIGLIPDFTAQEGIAAKRLYRVLPQWTPAGAYQARKVHAVYSPTRHVPQKVRAFIDFLVAAV